MGTLEAHSLINYGSFDPLAEQQLVDCSFLKYGNLACNGGLQENAYKYYEQGAKAELESVYPYTSGTTMKRSTCAYSKSSATAVSVSDYLAVTPDNVSQMKAALDKQPSLSPLRPTRWSSRPTRAVS